MRSAAKAPRVSIVIPAFNSEPYLEATIQSVRAQSIEAWELVVVDDGSLDRTADVAAKFADDDPRIRVLRTPNRGVANARNSGLAMTDPSSEFVILLDSDDVWEADALERLVGFLEAHPDLGSVYGLARCIDAAGGSVPGDDLEVTMRQRLAYRDGALEPIAPAAPLTFAAIVHENYVFTPGIHLMRRSVVDQVGVFDPAVDPADDWDFAARVCRLGAIGTLDSIVLNWRRHDQSILHTSPRLRASYFGARTKMMCDPLNTTEQEAVARDAFRSATAWRWSELAASVRAGRYREIVAAFDGRARYLRALVRGWSRRHGVRTHTAKRAAFGQVEGSP
jgi:glycosyltransferase involved in cell wall biosynthesis